MLPMELDALGEDHDIIEKDYAMSSTRFEELSHYPSKLTRGIGDAKRHDYLPLLMVTRVEIELRN